MKSVLCACIIALMVLLNSFNHLYALDIPYIRFGDKKTPENTNAANEIVDKVAKAENSDSGED